MAVAVICALACACGGSSRVNETPHRRTVGSLPPLGKVLLADALAGRVITIRARGDGVHRVGLDVTAHADMVLEIPAGTYFSGTPEGSFQNMIVTKATSARLAAGGSYSIVLPAACTNFHRRAPTPSDRLEIAPAEPELHRLVTCLEQHDVDDSRTQTLVWRHTDRIGRDDLMRRRDMLRPYLLEQCEQQLHQPEARCHAIVDAAYEVIVDKLLEQRDEDACIRPRPEEPARQSL